MTVPPPTPNKPLNSPAAVPVTASFSVRPAGIGPNPKAEPLTVAPAGGTSNSVRELRPAPRGARPTARRVPSHGDPARHRWNARADRRIRRRGSRARADAQAADRRMPALQAGGLRQRPAGLAGPRDGLDRGD